MKHRYHLEGLNYKLRPVELPDAQFIIDTRLEDPERNQYIHQISDSLKDQEDWINRYFEREGDYYFVIENRFSGNPEGLIGIYDENDGKAEWGRWVVQKGSLCAFESVYLLYRIAFEKIGLEELYCRTLVANEAVVSFHNSFGEQTRRIIPDASELNGKQYDVIEQFANREIFYVQIAPRIEKLSTTMLQRNLRAQFGSLDFHHIGVASKSIEQDEAAFALLGYSRESRIFEDELQGIRGVFLTAKGQPRLELLSDLNESGTVAPHLVRRNKMYHFAYQVAEIEKAREVLIRYGAKEISPLKQSSFFGTRITFLMMTNMYMIELVEKAKE